MKLVQTLIFLLLSVGTAVCQPFNRSYIVKHKIKSIKIQADNNDSNLAVEYNQKGFISKQITSLEILLPKGKQVETFTYLHDTILQNVVNKIKVLDSVVIADTTFYEYDSYGRLEFTFTVSGNPTNNLLTRLKYYDGQTGEISNQLWKKETYWKDTSNYYGSESCVLFFKNREKYFLRNYETYPFRYNPNITEFTYFFEKCESAKKGSLQVFCLTETTQRLAFGDTLVQEITFSSGNDYGKENSFQICDSVDDFTMGCAIKRVLIRNFLNGDVFHESVTEFGRNANVASTIYNYDQQGLIISDLLLQSTNIYGRSISSSMTRTYIYDFY